MLHCTYCIHFLNFLKSILNFLLVFLKKKFHIYVYIIYICIFPLRIPTYDKAQFYFSTSFLFRKYSFKVEFKKKLSQAILTVNIVKIYTHRVQQVFHQSVENVSVCSKLGGLYCFLMCPLLKKEKKTVVAISRT